jgi:hypothetical protein
VTLDDLLALLPDNTTGQISPADMRTIVTELFNAAHPPYLSVVNPGPVTLPASASFAAVPTTSPYALTLPVASVVEFCLSLNLDSAVNNNQVQLALDLSGATTVAAGSQSEQVLWAGGRQPVQSTLEVTYLQSLAAGTTDVALEYTAQSAGAQVSGMAVIATVVAEPS